MADGLEFKFFGWNNQGTSDKIWGWFTIGQNVFNVWGPRGQNKLVSLKFKKFTKFDNYHDNIYDVRKTASSKLRDGYVSVPVDVDDENHLVEIEKIYPGFTEHLKSSMFIARLSGTIKGEV